MKARTIRALAQTLFVVLCILGVAAWLQYPVWRFHMALARITTTPQPQPAEFYVNTFEQDVSSTTIKSLYYAACRKAKVVGGTAPLKMYFSYAGVERWERLRSVVQLPHGYIEVRVSESNDSDTVSVFVQPGTFDATGETLQPDETVPTNMLTRISWP